MTDNLPTNHLAPALQRQLLDAVGQVCSIAEGRRLLSLPVQALRSAIVTKIHDLGHPVTRPECDGALKDLALLLPRANLGAGEIERMLDLYFGLLREAGITRQMLTSACKHFVMAPKKGKARFFPDPGELVEICADDLRVRLQSLMAYRKALELLGNPEYDHDDDAPNRAEQLAEAARRLEELKTPALPLPMTQRAEGPESFANLNETLQRSLAMRRHAS